ncbi:dTDP-4-dehydrorhamnose 3,5-epimerase [candidate division KSB1 bacterium]|nr:dTDP-4-dehydrorhamnose 3,5-epimerase [candidate division KSB1 bacterium]RQW09429.1 MAG: dTDP-4-dehydrorhamnose 3,5-epimerase [candidate division KSB1 bacterium]
MIFHETRLKSAFIIELEELHDDRGFFARSWCTKEFLQHGLVPNVVQCNISYNKIKNTMRGMHYQIAPRAEAKLVRCTRGAIFDVIIDLRRQSSTFRQWIGIELTEDNRKMLYVPEDFAHGFLTLADDTEVFYQMSEFYSPEHARSIRWDDPHFHVAWPARPSVISDKDRDLPDFTEENLPV